jgi:hypothetical protein
MRFKSKVMSATSEPKPPVAPTPPKSESKPPQPESRSISVPSTTTQEKQQPPAEGTSSTQSVVPKNGSGGPELFAASPATNTVASFGRISVFGNLSGVLVTIAGNSAVYATAAGGLPIDLATILIQAAPFSQTYLNPADVVGFIPLGTSTNGYSAGAVKMGTPTYTAATFPFGGGPTTVRPSQQLATAPAWVRLQKGGVEVADGANTDTFTALLILARGGTNDN